MDKVRWGIIGAGGIAKKFVESLRHIDNAELTAVSSRDAVKAAEYASKFGAKRFHGSYKELAEDTEVDIVYIATPHAFHYENVLMCLKAGKAVLCEKPFTINASQAQELADTARSMKVFLMEAMWTRFLPAMAMVRELLGSGAIGEVRMIKADFGFRADLIPEGRLFDPRLGGGALLDVGIYPLSFASMVFGPKPVKVTGASHIGITGVDEQSAFILEYDKGQLAVLTAAVRTETPQDALILGTDGSIRIPMFWQADKIEITRDGKTDIIKTPYTVNGFDHEIAEAVKCLRSGRLESPVMPLDETVELMKLLDQIRSIYGLKYPGE